MITCAGYTRCAQATTVAMRPSMSSSAVTCSQIFDSLRLVLVMEYVAGVGLDTFMVEYGCGPAEAQQIGQQLTAGVAHMHSVG